MTRVRIEVLPTSWITRWVVLSIRVIVTIASTLFLVALQNLLAALAGIGWYKPMPMCLMIFYLSDQPCPIRPIYQPIYYWSIFWSLIVLPHWQLTFQISQSPELHTTIDLGLASIGRPRYMICLSLWSMTGIGNYDVMVPHGAFLFYNGVMDQKAQM